MRAGIGNCVKGSEPDDDGEISVVTETLAESASAKSTATIAKPLVLEALSVSWRISESAGFAGKQVR